MHRGIECLEEFAIRTADILLETDGLLPSDMSDGNNTSESGPFFQPDTDDSMELTE